MPSQVVEASTCVGIGLMPLTDIAATPVDPEEPVLICMPAIALEVVEVEDVEAASFLSAFAHPASSTPTARSIAARVPRRLKVAIGSGMGGCGSRGGEVLLDLAPL